MSNDDLNWLAAQRPRSASDKNAHDRALMALLRHATSRPTRRGRSGFTGLVNTRLLAAATGTGAAAIAAAVLLSANAGDGPPVTTHLGSGAAAGQSVRAVIAHHGPRTSLIALADDLSTSTASGDATLIQRTTRTDGQNITVYDLYGDNGTYYFSQAEGGLPGQVSSDNNQGAGVFAREVAAAKQAATGDVQQGALNMANAPAPNGKYRVTSVTDTTGTPAELAAARAKAKLLGQPLSAGTNFDNWAWEDAQDAIVAGAGDPEVRAGVLKIISLLPGVAVTEGTGADGQPTLVLTAGNYEVGANYQEQLTVNAETGMPIEFVGGAPGGPAATTVDYQVQRVTLSDIAAGNNLPQFQMATAG